MNVVRRFLVIDVAWAIGISVLLVGIGALTSDALSSGDVVRWVARALALAGFPAGIAIGPAVFGDARPSRALWSVIAAATAMSVVVFLLTGIVAPALDEPARSLGQLVRDMGATGENWETRNDAAWRLYTTIFAAVSAWLYAAIGVQVGAWSTHSLPRSFRRPLYWAVGLGLLITGYGIADTTYETFVLHTAADASIAAFYTLLLPLSVCAGLGLPTLALLRRADLTRPTG